MGRRVHRVARSVHAWAGAGIALVLLVLSTSGTILIVKADYLRLTIPEAREDRDLTPDGLGAVMNEAQARWGDELRAVVFAEEGFGLHQAYLSDGGAYLSDRGAVVAEWRGHARFEVWLTALHHDLTAGRAGRVVAGLVALATVALVVAGLVAFWPMRRGLRRGLRTDGFDCRELRSFHRNLGLVAALPTLLLALTGAAMSFPQTTKALFAATAPAGSPSEPPPVAAPIADWSVALARTGTVFPEADPRIAVPAGQGLALVRLRSPAEWHPNGRTVVRLGRDGVVVEAIDAQALPPGERAFNGIYPLHAAAIGGRLVDLASFAAGLALTLCAGAGLISFVRRGFPAVPRPRRPGTSASWPNPVGRLSATRTRRGQGLG